MEILFWIFIDFFIFLFLYETCFRENRNDRKKEQKSNFKYETLNYEFHKSYMGKKIEIGTEKQPKLRFTEHIERVKTKPEWIQNKNLKGHLYE